MSQISYNKTPSLYLIPTPIGNLEDITIRSIKILKEVDVIFAEDSRETKKLLNYLKINKKIISNFEYNEKSNKIKLLNYLKDNKNIGLVSDRGTPVISDPGYELVKTALKNNFNVIGLPGPTAFVPALIVSGLPPYPFLFFGFLNSKESKRKNELEQLKRIQYTIIFYESPYRIKQTLKNMLIIFGNRKISISREISKKFEEIYRGTIEDIILKLDKVKGELVLIVEGAKDLKKFSLTILEHINLYLKEGVNLKEAMRMVAKDRNISKNEIYKIYHNIE